MRKVVRFQQGVNSLGTKVRAAPHRVASRYLTKRTSEIQHKLWTLSLYFRFFKTSLTIGSRNCHLLYSLWAASFQIIFWIGYYLCFSWRFAIVNTHKYLVKSDEFLTSLYNDRTINLPDTPQTENDKNNQKKDNAGKPKK